MTDDLAKEITESTTGDVVVRVAPRRRAYAVSTTTSPFICCFKSMGQDVPSQKRIPEINPDHPVFEVMNGMLTSGADEQVQEYIDILYNQSLLLEGSKIKDLAAFAWSVATLMTGRVKGKDAA